MGPLHGLKVVEFAGLGPAPMAAMLLADLGADVIRIDRTAPSGLGVPRPAKFDILLRNRQSIKVDLKDPEDRQFVLKLTEGADVLIEGFRPGVMERLGLGPKECCAVNPKLVYGRMTGWGQSGPLSQAAGHDLNYIALTGVLHAIGRKGQQPTPPLGLLGDFAGGSLYLVFGILAALWEAQKSGKGQVVDAAIVDGVASLSAIMHAMSASGQITGGRGENLLDSGAFFYDSYRCKDGNYISIACIEEKFYKDMLSRIGVDFKDMPTQMDRSTWDRAREILADRFRTKTREEWREILEGTDACFAPVLSLDEAPNHPHMVERNTFIEVDGVTQPAPAPRFGRSEPHFPVPANASILGTLEERLADWGIPNELAGQYAGGTRNSAG